MIHPSLVAATLILSSTLAFGALTYDDNKYINAYNKEIATINQNYSALRTLEDYQDSQKRAKLEENFARLKKVIKSFSDQKDSQVVRMQRGYKNMVTSYNKNLQKAGVGASGSKSKNTSSTPTKKAQELTSEDKQNLKKFRSLYIQNDYYFRNVDKVKLQDQAYRKPLEAKLKELQTLLNPMRSKTFDRGVKQADADLSKIEKIFASASSESKKMASSVSNNSEELKAIQTVFDKSTFDPRLQRDYITGEPRSPEDVKEWASKLKGYKQLMPDMQQFLEKVRNNTIEGTNQEFKRYRTWFINSVSDDIDDAILTSTRRWETEMRNGIIKYRNYKANELNAILKSQSGVRELMEEYRLGTKALENQKVYEQATYSKLSAKTQEYIKDYKAYDTKLTDAKKAAIKNQRLPRAISNPVLLAVAKSKFKSSALKNISHINVSKNLYHTNLLKYSDGWYMLRWDAFNVSFVEQVGDRYFIKTASFKKDTENKYGLMNKGEWYLSTTSESGDEILKENIK